MKSKPTLPEYEVMSIVLLEDGIMYHIHMQGNCLGHVFIPMITIGDMVIQLSKN